jgi:hypothetical protein
MATERIVNVPINYKVNVVEIERVESASKKADEATQRLRQATSQYSKEGAQGYKFVSKSIEGMEIELARLRQQVKLANTENAAVAGKLSAQYKAAKAQLDQYNKSLLEQNKISKDTSRSTNDLASHFGEVYSAIRLIIAAGFAREVITISLNMAKLSGNVEGVTKAFNRLPNATLLLRDLREASQGTVTDLELMQKALQAQNYRIPLNNMAKLLEFAGAKAQQTGQDINHMFDYIVSGIGLRSLKRLDDLGFTANRLKGVLGDTSLQAATMGQVMHAVTTLMNEDLQNTGGLAVTAATGVGQLETAWHDLSVEVSKSGTSTGFIGLLKDAVNAVRIFVKAGFDPKNIPVVVALEMTSKLAEEQAALFTQGNEALTERQKILATDKKMFDLAETLKQYKDQTAAGKERIEVLDQEVAALMARNTALNGQQKIGTEEARLIEIKKAEIESTKNQTEALIHNKAVIAEVIDILADYRSALGKVNDTTIDDDDDPDGRKKPLNFPDTVVDIRFRDAKGNLTKENHEKVASDLVQNQLVPIIDKIHAQLMGIEQGTVFIPVEPFIAMSEWEKAFEANKEAIRETAFSIVQEQINAELMADVAMYDAK